MLGVTQESIGVVVLRCEIRDTYSTFIREENATRRGARRTIMKAEIKAVKARTMARETRLMDST